MKKATVPAMERNWHSITSDTLLREQSVDPDKGLTAAETSERQLRYGKNAITKKKEAPAIFMFLSQLNQPLVIILIIAGTITAVLKEVVDAAVIYGVVVVNAAIGFLQEFRARRAIEALAKSISKEATVLRGGERKRIPAGELTVGDVVVLQSGDQVPADLRLVNVRDLAVDESALTGESVPVNKSAEPVSADAVLADRTCMAYASTHVTYGTAKGIVIGIGDDTEIGKINTLISSAVSLETPLTKLLARLSLLMLYVILALAGITFAVGMLRGQTAIDMFMASVALAVGAIPEGLPAAITITLAIGVSTMAKRNAVIRKLPAVETLGSTTVICSDKTGTLTQNQMTVQYVWCANRTFAVGGTGYAPEGNITEHDAAVNPSTIAELSACLSIGTLCNDSRLVEKNGRWTIEGDPTEGALIVSAQKAGLMQHALNASQRRIDAIPFESQYQYMATLHDTGNGREAFVKGSVESIVSRSTVSAAESAAIHAQAEAFARQGLRVLAFARKSFGAGIDSISHAAIESGLAFAGLQAMIDPPRPEAVAAVASCKNAGISVKMITGDHMLTAFAIAQKLGIAAMDDTPEKRALNGKRLSAMSDEEISESVKEISVFARVSPEDKLRLVTALQRNGNIVAMTGDGVNDAPSLKQANIGVAMGITGTDVAKESADMVLTDDNFATIKAAVEEGRGVYDNLVKFITWTLPTNFGEGLVILIAIVLGIALPIIPVQILWINMTTAILLGLMLAFEPKEPGIMERKPRAVKEPILTNALIMRIVIVGTLLCIAAFGAFEYALPIYGEGVARTIAVNIFVFGELFYLFNCRSLYVSIFKIGFFTNPFVWLGVGLMTLLQLAFTYAPFMNTAFHTKPIPPQGWILILASGIVIFFIIAIEKRIQRFIRTRR